MIKYIAKKDTWFMAGAECEVLVDCRPKMNLGVFRGLRISEGKPELHAEGEVYLDEEDCSFDEFEAIDV